MLNRQSEQEGDRTLVNWSARVRDCFARSIERRARALNGGGWRRSKALQKRSDLVSECGQINVYLVVAARG